jgi:hypothetical protein
VSNCLVKDFVNFTATSGYGIVLAPNSSDTFNFDINNTVVTNSAGVGLHYSPPSGVSPTANIIVDHVAAKGNFGGIRFDADTATGGNAYIAVSNSVASNNSNSGIEVSPRVGTTMTVAIDSVVASGNGVTGIAAGSVAHVLLGRSVITGNGFHSNGFGAANSTTNDTFFTYGNNQINGNLADIASGTIYNPLVSTSTQ